MKETLDVYVHPPDPEEEDWYGKEDGGDDYGDDYGEEGEEGGEEDYGDYGEEAETWPPP